MVFYSYIIIEIRKGHKKRYIRLEDKHKTKIGSKGLFNSINEFMDYLNENCSDNGLSNVENKVYCIQVGGKYLKVITCLKDNVATGGGGSVYCFIDAKTGDIYKSAGWRAPYTKGKNAVRSNVMDDDYKSIPTRNMLYGGWLYL